MLVLVVGAIATNVMGKRIIRWGESLLAKIPISRTIYEGIRQIIQSFSDPEKIRFYAGSDGRIPQKRVFIPLVLLQMSISMNPVRNWSMFSSLTHQIR